MKKKQAYNEMTQAMEHIDKHYALTNTYPPRILLITKYNVRNQVLDLLVSYGWLTHINNTLQPIHELHPIHPNQLARLSE